MSLDFSRDGKTLVEAGLCGQISRWDVATGLPLGRPVELGPEIFALASSPDARMILATNWDDYTAQISDAATGRPIGPPLVHSANVTTMAFSPDGRTILTASDKVVRRWDVATGRPIGPPGLHPDEVSSVIFSPDGQTMIIGCRDGSAQLQDAATGRPIGPPLAHPSGVFPIMFSPDGRTILILSSDNVTRVWDAATIRPIGLPIAHPGGLFSATFSSDGRTILTGCTDNTARSWDVATGQPIGPPLLHPSSGRVFRRPTMEVSQVGRTVLTHDGVSTRLWDVPTPLPEDVPRLTAWVEAATGLELDERGSIRVLDRSAWLERRSRMDQLGGPPPPDPAPRLDPILFGVDPSTRGDAWKERGEWDRAEAAYAEAIRARPLDGTIRSSLARLQLERGHLDRAAATLAEAVRQMPDDLDLRLGLGDVLLWSGDRAGWRRSNVALVDEFGGTINARSAYRAARACVLGMEGSADPEVPVLLAEAAVRVAETAVRRTLNEPARPYYLNILGAALYRAGRYDGAIRRLEEAIGARRGRSGPADWVFLAMAHDRLGHRDEARRWLDRLREYQPSTAASKFWDELEIRLLRSEAEAVILCDPVFPADPFAP